MKGAKRLVAMSGSTGPTAASLVIEQALLDGRHGPARDGFEGASWVYAIRGKTYEGKTIRVCVAIDGDGFLVVTVQFLREGMKDTKVVKKYVDWGSGFAVTIHNAPMKKRFGEWVLDIPPAVVNKRVFESLLDMSGVFSGHHVRFIRHYMKLTYQGMANLLGVKHATVIGWEKKGDGETKMQYSTELLLRMIMARFLGRETSTMVDKGHELVKRGAIVHLSLEGSCHIEMVSH